MDFHFLLLTNESVEYLHTKTVVQPTEKKTSPTSSNNGVGLSRLRVIPWTVNETNDMLVLKGMGVDGFITDYPDRAAKFKLTLNIKAGKK